MAANLTPARLHGLYHDERLGSWDIMVALCPLVDPWLTAEDIVSYVRLPRPEVDDICESLERKGLLHCPARPGEYLADLSQYDRKPKPQPAPKPAPVESKPEPAFPLWMGLALAAGIAAVAVAWMRG